MERKRIKSKAWLDLLKGEEVDRAATRVAEKSHITTSIVDVDYTKNGDKMYKERSIKEWK